MSESDDELQWQTDEWIIDIEMALGCVDNNQVKTGSICKVPEKIREANKEKSEDWFRPKFMAMGSIHRGATMETQIRELTKWRYMQSLLKRPTQGNLLLTTVENCSKSMKGTESIVRASYGDKIDLGRDELPRIMILDACFLLELLLKLITNKNNDTSVLSDLDTIDHHNKVSRLLTDLVLLENQIPFILLTALSSALFHCHEQRRPRRRRQEEEEEEEEQQQQQQQHLASLLALSDDKKRFSPQKLAHSLFQCYQYDHVVDFSKGVYHFLHLIHLCSPDPYQQPHILSKDPVPLRRCATKLQALGITIKTTTSQTDDNVAVGNRRSGTVASAIREFMDKFEFGIKFDEKERELIIPTLHIKEATEVKWRNFIAWEQTGRLIGGVGYKFTSYGYFFKGLVCSVRDVKLLREIGVIKAHPRTTDEELFIMLKSIVTGAQHMDARYRKVCKKLNKARKGVLILRMPWHYWWRSMEGLQYGLISLFFSFRDNYRTPWKWIGIAVGAALLALTITQTIYTIRGVK